MKKITEIKEKVELKDLEVQADPCANMPGTKPCKYDCCHDCYNGTSSYVSPKL
ncbi:hypothetical protein [Paraclostridium sordellii]|uniref:hypothetical protein n=1 Tax=Paraclostridium sordellii TaxID=1505 RepID=UPI0005DDF3C7|nr:hypothetical protein [Paeniclostridium sordellii]MCR1850919.1 hypothetical protein [Paeniclostridium sordellii]CEP43603.1 Uncharacterised protein [[Clostridium] sordellii] [Paeniclostridium sordellii]